MSAKCLRIERRGDQGLGEERHLQIWFHGRECSCSEGIPEEENHLLPFTNLDCAAIARNWGAMANFPKPRQRESAGL